MRTRIVSNGSSTRTKRMVVRARAPHYSVFVYSVYCTQTTCNVAASLLSVYSGAQYHWNHHNIAPRGRKKNNNMFIQAHRYHRTVLGSPHRKRVAITRGSCVWHSNFPYCVCVAIRYEENTPQRQQRSPLNSRHEWGPRPDRARRVFVVLFSRGQVVLSVNNPTPSTILYTICRRLPACRFRRFLSRSPLSIIQQVRILLFVFYLC